MYWPSDLGVYMFYRNFPDKFMWKVLVETWFHRVPNRSRWPRRSRCSRGFPRGAGAFLPWQWISWRSKFPSLTSAKVNPNMLISVISLQILSKFINETSGYHGYHGYLVWVTSCNIHEIHHLMCFRMTCHGWPPGNILRNDGSFVSALVRQSHGYHWPIGGTNSTTRRK